MTSRRHGAANCDIRGRDARHTVSSEGAHRSAVSPWAQTRHGGRRTVEVASLHASEVIRMNSKWLPVLVLAASAAVLPSGTAAALVPIPLPPVRLPVAQVGACVLTVADAYGFVSPAE